MKGEAADWSGAQVAKDRRRGQLVAGESPWGSPAFRVQGKKPRVVVDYRKANTLTVRAVFLMPTTDGTKSRVMGRRWFSSGDGVSGFNQICNTEFAKLCLAVIAMSGKWLPQSLVFGPQNGPEDFGRFTCRTFRAKLFKVWYFFVDDVMICTGWATNSNRALEGDESIKSSWPILMLVS